MATFATLETLTTSYSLTTTSVDDMGYLNVIYTTTTSVVTALSTISPQQHIYIDIANKYIDSLSDQQLAEFEERLLEKENEILLDNGQKIIIEEPKENTVEKTYKKI